MIIIVMGVSGCGKTTIGKLVAAQLGWTFVDGDDYHPQSNVDKMASGNPLTDEDRKPWLETLADLLADLQHRGDSAVLACSALKQSYRDTLNDCGADPVWVYLRGDVETLNRRLEERAGHFMKSGMLESQFDALEEPANALILNAADTQPAIVSTICQLVTN